MLHDPREYSEPERFNPSRFMKDGRINPDVRDPDTVAFGFGRRYVDGFILERSVLNSNSSICPGRHFAKDNAFLTIASVLHVFDILPSLNEYGVPHDPTPKMTTGLLS
jgi:cytochrome P450